MVRRWLPWPSAKFCSIFCDQSAAFLAAVGETSRGHRQGAMFTLRLLGSVSLQGPGGAVKGRISARQPLAVLAVLAAFG